jgi:hypothetical protein
MDEHRQGVVQLVVGALAADAIGLHLLVFTIGQDGEDPVARNVIQCVKQLGQHRRMAAHHIQWAVAEFDARRLSRRQRDQRRAFHVSVEVRKRVGDRGDVGLHDRGSDRHTHLIPLDDEVKTGRLSVDSALHCLLEGRQAIGHGPDPHHRSSPLHYGHIYWRSAEYGSGPHGQLRPLDSQP